MAITNSPLKSFLKHRSKGIVYVLGTCIVIGMLFYISLGLMGSCLRLSCLELPKGSVLKLTEVYEEVRGSVYRARYQMGDIIVRIDVRSDVDPEASIDYINGRIAGMKALYDNIRSPYPGLLSNEIVCDEGFKPTYKSYENANHLSVQTIIGYLNERLTFGSCQKDQAIYKGAMVLFSCPSKRQLYQVEFITKNEEFNVNKLETIIDGLGCR